MSKRISRSQSMNTSALQEKALELIGSRSGGLYQSELRKILGIESGKCSKIVSRMERSGLIVRDRATTGSRWTYLIRLARARPGKVPPLHIDTYLTEIYLLYLMRGSTSA